MDLGKREIIVNKYGLKLAAISFIPAQYTHVVIICHGFNGAKENSGRIFTFAPQLNELKLGVLAFDFTGNGESEGEFQHITLTRHVQDLAAVIDFAKKKYHSPLLLLGRSFGGSTIAASVMLNQPIAAYIFWSAPVYLTETFSRLDPPEDPEEHERENKVKHQLLEDFKNHDMGKCLIKLKEKPVIAIHGSDDEVVSLDNIELFKQYLPLADYEIVPGAGHRFDNHIKIRDEITISWLRKVLHIE